MDDFKLFEGGNIVLVLQPVSWRYGMRGLKLMVSMLCNTCLEDSPDWFVFIHKKRTAARVLHCTGQSVTLYEQRFVDGSRFPSRIKVMQESSGQVQLTREELKLMFSGGTGTLRFS